MRSIDELTIQECRVLELVAKGRRNTKIAIELFISIHTIEVHLYRIFQKLGVSSRTEAAIYASQSGLLLKPKSSGNTDDEPDGSNYYGS